MCVWGSLKRQNIFSCINFNCFHFPRHMKYRFGGAKNSHPLFLTVHTYTYSHIGNNRFNAFATKRAEKDLSQYKYTHPNKKNWAIFFLFKRDLYYFCSSVVLCLCLFIVVFISSLLSFFVVLFVIKNPKINMNLSTSTLVR